MILGIIVAAGAVALLLALIWRETVGTFGSGRRAALSKKRGKSFAHERDDAFDERGASDTLNGRWSTPAERSWPVGDSSSRPLPN